MSKKTKIYHLLILDKSWSMGSVRDETINGVNEQFAILRQSQKEEPEQEQCVCFVQFSSHNMITEPLWCAPISDVKDLTRQSYNPDGDTAMNDAVGRSVVKLDNAISEEIKKEEASVLVSIFTDGEENDSQEFKNDALVAELLEKVQKTGRWTVAFIGCGDNVFRTADKMRIRRSNTLAYKSGSVGTRQAFSKMARSTAAYSRGLSAGAPVADLQRGYFEQNEVTDDGLADDDDE